MKRTYNYHTERLTNRSLYSNGRNRLYEGVNNMSFNDILERSKGVFRNATCYNAGTINFKKILFSPSPKPIIVWEYKGNYSAKEFVKLCDAANIDYCFINARRFNGDITDEYNDEAIIIIDDFTSGTVGKVSDLIFEVKELADNKVAQIICIGNIDSPVNDDVAGDIAKVFTNYVLDTPDDSNAIPANESVAEKFAKYRRLYESEDEEEEDDEDTVEDEKAEDAEDSKEDEETEDVPMTAIVLTIKKDDVEKCKEELVDAGISEDGIIEVDDDDDEDTAKLKVDADYAFELKDYLAGKGIDLEEKIGGEIIDDSAEDSDEDKEGEDNKEGKEKAAKDDTDFDAEFGDLFGDDAESGDNE